MIETINSSKRDIQTDRRMMHRRCLFSSLIVCLLILLLFFISWHQYQEYRDIYPEYLLVKEGTAQLHACLDRKRLLKEEYDTLLAQQTRINRIRYKPKNPSDVLAVFSQTTDVSIQDISLRKKKLDLVVTAPSDDVIFSYATQLQTLLIPERIDIAALEQVDNQIKALLHIILK